jgi:hypothetical protein
LRHGGFWTIRHSIWELEVDKMKNKALVIVCSVTCLLGMASIAQCDIYNPATGHWYDIVSSGANGSWTNAENDAIALGGHLVTINDAAEEAWLRTNFGWQSRYWIGFTDAAQEGTWVWSSGEAVTYTNWDEGEANNSKPPDYGENYAVVNWDTATGQWNDWDHMRPDYYHIDGIYENPVPVPGAVLLGALGLSVAGWRLRRETA